MTEAIPTESSALNYVKGKGWPFQLTGLDQIKIETCPYCANANWKMHMNVSGTNRDGLWDCKVCSEAGSLHKLMSKLGDRMDGVLSMRESELLRRAPDPIPDIGAAHKRLMDDEEALDYLVGTRGFSIDVIEKYQLGLEVWRDNVKWVLIPYKNGGNIVFVKFRSLPPADKMFRGIAGREAPLFNEDCIVKDMDELIFVEGEADALSLLSNGITNVVGVPGAALKKTSWITKLDEMKPKKIYILYDNDIAGQKGAKELAARIGFEKCYNILLPEFLKDGGEYGKDANEWFKTGKTATDFQDLKATAVPFDVEGVTHLGQALLELEEELLGVTQETTLKTPWPSLDRRLGGVEYGDLVGIIAEGKVGKTTMAMNWLDYYVQQGLSCFLYCLEMPPKRIARKWVSYMMQVDDTPYASELKPEHVTKAKEIAISREAEFLFGYTRGGSKQQVFDTIRQAVRRYGVKVVCFDNLQLLCRSIEHSAQETAVLSRQFKELAMELKIVILLIIQPNRVKDGEIVAARNANGSSAIEKDVDSMIALHRNRIAKIKANDFQGFLDTDENFEPQMLARVDLSRYAPGGNTTLWMDGARSTVREFNSDELTNLPKPNFGSSLPTEVQAV
jgi:5S rRNA maturation endonuclease (ribonuclease M5)/KaiC/GvpD/RAD55 family RecA-like ATPase